MMQDDRRLALQLPARMDHAAVAHWHDLLRDRANEGATLVLDGSGVAFVTTPALQLILSALRSFGRASLARPSVCLEEAFADLGIDWRKESERDGAAAEPDPAGAEAEAARAPAARATRRILTIDDSRTMRDMLMLTLTNAGFDVIQGVDGADGLNALGDGAVDLVITDINMPVMDGYEVIRRLRGNDNYKATPILVLTTEGDAEKRAIAREAGATGWIVKPFDPERLVETIRHVAGA